MSGVDPPDVHEGDVVLRQATRRRLFVTLAELGGAASTDELADRLGLHPNGVRTHLQRMRDAGLIVHRRAARPRGRPRDEWAVAPTARAAVAAPQAYATLARWLTRAIPATRPRLREVEASGRAIGHELAEHAAGAQPRQALVDRLAAFGFQPEAEVTGDELRCRLRNCPFAAAVRENQDVVCALHRGITIGMLDRLAPTAALARFVPHDPDTAGCEIDVVGLPAMP